MDSITEEEREQFKENVRAWLAYDDKIRKIKAGLKEMKKAQAVLTSSIKDFMVEHNIDDLNTMQGKIRYQKKAVKAPLTLSEIKEKVNELSTSAEPVSVHALSEILFKAERPLKERETLRRIVPRTSLNLNI